MSKIIMILQLLAVLCAVQHASSFVVSSIDYILYTSSTEDEFNVNNFNSILTNPNFDTNKPTVLYLYGFSQSKRSSSVREVRDAYIQNGQFNFILLSNSVFLWNLFNAKPIGNAVADNLIDLIDDGYDASKIHLVGFSLGAQIAGIVGRGVQARSSNILGRISGLDPGKVDANQLSFIDSLLASSDASFVDVIHTESTSFGSAATKGQVDFYVNGGDIQYMCTGFLTLTKRICSHEKAPKYWIETIVSSNQQNFPATKCRSYTDFQNSNCDANEPVGYMGLYTSETLSGDYYLDTNSDSPYSKPL